MLRASGAAEAAGYMSVSIVTSGFLRQAQAVAESLVEGGLSIVEYPGVIMMDSEEELRDKVRSRLVPAIIEALTRR